mgnify:CR=1 FL=1
MAQLASLHVAAYAPNLWRYEDMFIDNPLREMFTEPFPQQRDGLITMPSGPGLGLAVDRAKLERHRLP